MLFVNARKQERHLAVIGIGCRYPGARNPRELWENIVARRREFRRIPDCRLPLGEYHDPDRSTPDKTYGTRAGVIDGFQFDWAGNRIPKTAFDSMDLVQWLALDVAAQALGDAGYTRDSVPRDRTGVILGNTLTGEHTRSNSLRLRWPFVRKALRAALTARGMGGGAEEQLLETMEQVYKSVFPEVTEDTLAGGLSNTIAGRVCNFFDLHGGGYTVDGACSSSLLAVCTACNLLVNNDLDMVLAGGVDVSLDTFELIGFAKTGALTPDEMRVYDQRANGFIPGEGCGFVVLKRLEDAIAARDQIYAVVRGWGVSSDGKGGLTAPSSDGQATAIRRAYSKAGYGLRQVDFVEGHGTGTKVGDKVELEGLAKVLAAESTTPVPPRSLGVTSFKSIVGHTKAAAGVGAFIKSVIAVNRRVLPPTAGCSQPNPVFETTARGLYPIMQGEVVDPLRKLRAGVSAMGFGGINSHVTLESGDPPSDKLAPSVDERVLLAANQETELFVLTAGSTRELAERLPDLAAMAELVSLGDLTDLAARWAAEVDAAAAVRMAVIAATPTELAERLRAAAAAIQENPPARGQMISGPQRQWLIGHQVSKARLGFMLPGQGSQQLAMARRLVERFRWARELVEQADRWLAEVGSAPVSPLIFRAVDRAHGPEQLEAWQRELAQTQNAQPAIVLASLLQARYLQELGLKPAVVAGHSLGELTAFHLAGAMDAESVIKLAAVRGQAMAAPAEDAGAMASLACSRELAEALVAEAAGYVVVANSNSPLQTVVSGEDGAIEDVIQLAAKRNINARRLPVSNAFHSQMVKGAAARLRAATAIPEQLDPPALALISSMTGKIIDSPMSLPEHFATQVLSPVDFIRTVQTAGRHADLFIEVGPGRVLSGLVEQILGEDGKPCLPVASQPAADRDLQVVLAAAFVQGWDVSWSPLYAGRLVRPFVPASERVFIDNPCERPLQVPEAAEELPALAGAFEMELMRSAEASAEEVESYLSERRQFLVDVAKADLRSRGPARVQPQVERPAAPRPEKAPARKPQAATVRAEGAADLESLLIDLAAKRTGFPRESITLEAKLLDDLNLDSIKAAELVAGAAKQMGVAGKVDPTKLANARLAEVAAAIRAVAGDQPAAAPAAAEAPVSAPAAAIDEGPSWVRDFVIEYVPQSA